jgi:hypothetical protein
VRRLSGGRMPFTQECDRAGSRKATGARHRGLVVRDAPQSGAPHHEGQHRDRRCNSGHDLLPLTLRSLPQASVSKGEARTANNAHLMHIRSRGVFAPELSKKFVPLSKRRAQGRPGAGRRPWSACNKKHAAEPQAQPRSPGLPCAMVLRIIRDLPGERLSCPRRGRLVIAHLASAPRCQNHATSSSHRDRSSARASPRCVPMRPPHPAPDVRDDREAPPQRDGMRGVEHDF